MILEVAVTSNSSLFFWFNNLLHSAQSQSVADYYYDFSYELRLHLGKDLSKDKGRLEVVKHKDTGEYLCYIYIYAMRKQDIVHEENKL